MANDDQCERSRAELERLRQSGAFRTATPDDTRTFGKPPTPRPPLDRTSLGVPLAEAIWRFARDPVIGRRFLDLSWRAKLKSVSPDSPTFEELQEYFALRDGLSAELVEGLAAVEVEAFRLLDAGTREAVVRAAWWFGARLDPERDEATSHGETVCGLLFRRPLERTQAPRVIAPPRDTGTEGNGPRSRRAELRATLQKLMSEGRSFKTDTEAHHAVLTHLGVKGSARGFSIDTFRDVCRGVLRGETTKI